ncbi:MAG: glycosyltransferase [Planctomycetota bacterium]|nr:glycosyltransferase [Planctomycetota bacterium]
MESAPTDLAHDAKVEGAPRVAFVVHVMQVAGAEVLVAETIRRLAGRIQPTIFCLDSIGTLGEQLLSEGVDVISFDRKAGKDWSLIPRMAAEIRSRKINVLHAHQYTPFFYAGLANLRAGLAARVIFTEHGRHYPDCVSRKRYWANRLALQHLAHAVTGCCEFSAAGLSQQEGFQRREIQVILNGIEFERYYPALNRAAAKQSLGLDPSRRYIAKIARFHSVKDHATLIRGFARLCQQQSDVDLLLVGDGPLRAVLEQQVADLQIQSRVHFLGIRHDIPDILRATDVFALTSLSEAASLTLLEAMASAVPVVVTNVGGNPEIVREGVDGRLVPRGDDVQLSKALNELLSNPDLACKLGSAARQRVLEHFRIQDTIDQYYRLYEKLSK